MRLIEIDDTPPSPDAVEVITSLRTEPLQASAAGRMYVLSTGRNAWQSTWSKSTLYHMPLAATLADAKSVVEGLREGSRGSKWYITWRPGLVLRGYTVQLIITSAFSDVVTPAPARDLERGLSVLDAAEVLAPSSGGVAYTRLASRVCELDALTRDRESLQSKSYGGRYALGWQATPAQRYDASRLNAIVAHVNAALIATEECAGA